MEVPVRLVVDIKGQSLGKKDNHTLLLDIQSNQVYMENDEINST